MPNHFMLNSFHSPTDWEEIVLKSILSPVSLFFENFSLTFEVSVSMIYNSYYFSPDSHSKLLKLHNLTLTRG